MNYSPIRLNLPTKFWNIFDFDLNFTEFFKLELVQFLTHYSLKEDYAYFHPGLQNIYFTLM